VDGLVIALHAVERAVMSERNPGVQIDQCASVDYIPASASFTTEHGQVQ
jgi:hypothetical protein